MGSYDILGLHNVSAANPSRESVPTPKTRTGLPNVIHGFPDDPPTAITDVFFWTPQVIGGMGFIISSILLMIEVQKKWWLPNLRSMGW